MEEAEQGMLALHDEVCDWPVESSHNQAEHQSREISQHYHDSSVKIHANDSIGGRA